ncbi:hypothetical protein DXG03_001939 [Asterophora parasitica]|uniref:SPRY-domain-containing protein n=1 Tax=Asterophora parasitica TaxID=117018 RepID=A0A9P7GDT9_9AGAR|nr:hypothetical protein DXG03_001939 [Asterophora parasitica]
MTTRPTRSASIPIGPRGASSHSPGGRNIESVISIPFAAAPRPRISSAQSIPRSTVDDHRGLGVSYGARGSSSTAIATSPPRPTARSMAFNSASGRHSYRASSTFEPRVIRAGGEVSHSVDAACLPSTSPVRPRRQSTTASGRGASTQRPIPGVAVPASQAPPVSFPRPSYLDHSVLRHLLQIDTPPTLPPSRKADPAHEHHVVSSPITATSDSDEESNVSPPRELRSAPLPVVPQNQILRLPTRWSDQFRHALLSVSGDGRDLTYHGASCSGDRDAAAARTDHPVPAACGIYYYEVEIISKGQKGHISIGFAGRDVRLSRLPGWEINSWGYHGDDGCSFAAEKTGTKYGPTFGTGDIIGCGVDFTSHRAFFTKNGALLGPVFDNIGKDIEIYPSIGLRHAGEAVRVNFGHESFKFDIDFHVLQKRNHIWSKILNTPLDSSLLQTCLVEQGTSTSALKVPLSEGQTKDVINKLVVTYLEHHGYVKTLRAFQKQRDIETQPPFPISSSPADADVDMVSPQDESSSSDTTERDMERRTRIVKSVIAGDIDTAIAETKAHHVSVLEAEEGLLLFKLRCRKFVELILEAAELKKKMRRIGTAGSHDDGVIEEMDGLHADGMDVDDEDVVSSPQSPNTTNGFGSAAIPVRGGGSGRRRTSMSPTDGEGSLGSPLAQYESTLHQAIAYGQTLSNDYKNDARLEVKQIFKRTFAIVAWEDPLTAGGVVSEVVGHDAKVALANELNRAILRSQGRPPIPLLETIYRQTSVFVSQLGLMGVGGATFADMQREFLDA